MQLASIALVCAVSWTLAVLWSQSPRDDLGVDDDQGAERRIRAEVGRAGPGWAAFELEDLRAERKRTERAYLDFLGVSTLSTGLYVLPRGGTDGQTPHVQDEVYAVLRGRATLQIGDESVPVQAGSVVFVAAHRRHRFVDITEELEVLVFFSSAVPADGADEQDEQ